MQGQGGIKMKWMLYLVMRIKMKNFAEKYRKWH